MASERKFVAENVRRVLLKEYLMKEVSRAGFGGLDVQRTPMGTSVILSTERPGLVIGRRGQTIKNLTQVIEERFKFENPQIEVHEVENANVNAQIMAEKLAFSLERGWHFRRAGHSSVRRIMESGAKGCHIIISGKLTGQRHRTEKFKDGYIKFCGDPKLRFMDKGYAVAKLKQGIIGVTVEIMEKDSKLPADITVLGKTEAALALPDLFGGVPAAPAEPVEPVAEEKPKKKAPAKKKAEAAPAAEVAEPVAEVAEPVAEVAEPVAEEKPKKAPAKKKAEPKADAEAKPKKAPAKKKAEPKADAEAKPKKATKKKADAEEAQ
jgi:ribosomal protein S3, eukaryotic/archaeal type